MRACFIVLAFATSEVLACSCTPELPIEDQFAAATVVASVQVQSVADGVDMGTVFDEVGRELPVESPTVVATTQVVEQFKGPPTKGLKLVARARGAGCHLAPPMAVGDVYVVFVGADGISTYDLCSRPTRVREVPEALLTRWREL